MYWWDLDILDDDGVIRWKVREEEWDTISISNLIESEKAGLICGNPLKIYVILSHGYGNGSCVSWPAILNQLEIILDWAIRLGFVYTVVYSGIRVIRDRYQEWQERRADPQDIYYYITNRKSWDPRDLGKRLAIRENEAKSILRLFGYEYDRQSRLYVKSQDKNAILIYNKFKDIFEEE